MNIEGFRKFGKDREYTEQIIEEAIFAIKDFNDFLVESNNKINSATNEDIHNYAQYLIDTGRNSKAIFYGLVRYNIFTGNNDMLITTLELLDGSDVLDNLARELKETVGAEKADEILKEIEFPPLGTSAGEKPIITKKVIDQLAKNLDEKTCKKILVSNLHGIPKESYQRQRENYLKARNVDEYLKERNANFIKLLEKHRDEKTLFYTQEIDDEVVEHCRNNPQIESGVRKGNIVYAEKIPYMTKKFLKETDENMKNYYYCHCMWVREALKTGNVKVPSKFCECSAGYYKNQWDVILDQPVNVDVVETILDGNPRCLFAIHLPDDVVKKAEEK
ncbi:MAG: hypothetical protein FK733_03600 [Asgard group archaeon]|nr:hypothetical protein [Asgard group archaeon]